MAACLLRSLFATIKCKTIIFFQLDTYYRIRNSGEIQDKMNSDTRQFLQNQMVWLAASLAISFIISWFLPFPFSLVVIIGVFMAMGYFIRQRQMRRMGMGGSSSFSGSFFGGSLSGNQRGGIDYYCMSCGKKHNERACPNCGSTMKRIG